MTKSKALTWEDLADLYDKAHGGRRARTLPMDHVFKWAESQSDKFWVDPEKGTIHKKRREIMTTKKTTTTAIEKQAPKAGEIMLNLDNVRKYIAPTGTVTECEEFLNLCAIWDLNPFKREIYFIKYDKAKPATTVVGYEVYLKRAERQKLLKGWKVWTEYGEDSAGKKTLKACIKIHRKDWDQPFEHEVYFEEYAQYRKDYNKNTMVLTKFWKEKPRTMLKKVVIGQAFRMCFPDEMGGLPYTSEEMPEALDTAIDAEPIIKATVETEEPKPKPRKKPVAKEPTSLIPDVPPELLGDGAPKEGVSKEEYKKIKGEKAKDAEDDEVVDILADIVEEDADRIAITNAIEQKLVLLDKHYGRKKVKLIEKIHLVLKDKFGVAVAKFPDDLDKGQLAYVLELLQVTVDKEESNLRGKDK